MTDIDVNDIYKRAVLAVMESETGKMGVRPEERLAILLEDEELASELNEVINKLYVKYLPENLAEFILHLLMIGVYLGRERVLNHVKDWGIQPPS